MDITFTEEELAFQDTFSTWLSKHLPKDWKKQFKSDPVKFHRWWQGELNRGGYGALTWPKEYGGMQANAVEQLIYHTVMAKAGAPRPYASMGINIIGPTLILHGTEEQKKKYLPEMLNGNHIWCQGFSEPNAGSDLASLSTKAVIDGEELVITGQKIWTSNAHFSDYMCALVRTDSSDVKQYGITYVIIDMKSPGITIRPIVQISKDQGFSEVFFEEVRVPIVNIVGEIHQGWSVAHSTIGNERGTYFLARQIGIERIIKRLIRVSAEESPYYGESEKEAFTDLAIKVHALKALSYRVVSQSQKGQSGPEASVTKLLWSELQQSIFNTAIEKQGSLAPFYNDPDYSITGQWQLGYLRSRGATIGAGTSEIQRNVIAEKILGMPRDN